MRERQSTKNSQNISALSQSRKRIFTKSDIYKEIHRLQLFIPSASTWAWLIQRVWALRPINLLSFIKLLQMNYKTPKKQSQTDDLTISHLSLYIHHKLKFILLNYTIFLIYTPLSLSLPNFHIFTLHISSPTIDTAHSSSGLFGTNREPDH